MTAQIREKLIIEEKESSMAFCPPIPDKHPMIKVLSTEEISEGIKEERISSFVLSTGCWRGYIGSWKLKGGKLYLVDVRGRYYYDGDEPIFANWVTCGLRIPDGELLQYVHMGFGSVYEYENHIKIENGIVIQERRIDNRGKDTNRWDLGWDNLPGNENKFDGDDL